MVITSVEPANTPAYGGAALPFTPAAPNRRAARARQPPRRCAGEAARPGESPLMRAVSSRFHFGRTIVAALLAALACEAGAAAQSAPAKATPGPVGPVVVATHDTLSNADALLYVEGNTRIPATGGPGAGGYGLLETLPDGTMLVAFTRSGFGEVDSVSPTLQTRTLRTFPLSSIGFVAPSSDGFVFYSQTAQYVQRYDAQGRAEGGPMAALGATSALGLGSAT